VKPARRPALVVVDVGAATAGPLRADRNNPGAERAVAALLEEFRSRALPVVHVRHDIDEAASPHHPGGQDPGEPEIAPLPGEPVVAKSTTSAFIGTELASTLRRCGCDAVVFVGLATNTSVEATVRMSGDLGYRSFVVADATAAAATVDLRGRRWEAEDVHAMALANLDGAYARVVNVAEVVMALPPVRGPSRP
jgi:nicotinamidase-related amidase